MWSPQFQLGLGNEYSAHLFFRPPCCPEPLGRALRSRSGGSEVVAGRSDVWLAWQLAPACEPSLSAPSQVCSGHIVRFATCIPSALLRWKAALRIEQQAAIITPPVSSDFSILAIASAATRAPVCKVLDVVRSDVEPFIGLGRTNFFYTFSSSISVSSSIS